ncbi:hypothetical protein CC2G_004347 [Coprinopsis cinerea AmutBmut pab1-1]|nr:hypothetical protein CC2G_004347 [Coprinopsis cinerea AmutBmut pab1-1]
MPLIERQSTQHFKQASNWPRLIIRSLEILNEYDAAEPGPAFKDENRLATLALFCSLAHRNDQVDAHKIIANFEFVVPWVTVVYQGIINLPSTLPEFKDLLLQKFSSPDSTIPSESWDRLFSKIKTMHSFKLPLQLALGFSPICLFFPSLLMTKDMNRSWLFWIWHGLGGPRGDTLQRVECAAWLALNEIASGQCETWPRLRTFFRSLKTLGLEGVAHSDAIWLEGDPCFFEEPSTPYWRSISTPATTPPIIQPPGTTSATSTPSKPVTHRPVTRSLSGAIPSPDPKSSTSYSRSSSRSAGRGPCDKGLNSPSVSIRKREHGELLDTDTTVTPGAVKRRRGPNGASIRVIDIIDLTVETAQQVINLILDEEASVVTHYTGRTVAIARYTNIRGSYLLSPQFRFKDELEWFQGLLKASETQYEPLRRTSRARESMIASFSCSVLLRMDARRAQSIFRAKCIVSYGIPSADYGFGEEGFRTLTMHNLDKVVPVIDFSISPDHSREVHGSLSQLLASRSAFKPLAAPHFPMPNGVSPPPGFLSDVAAWDYMVGLPWCGIRWEMPRSALKWGAAFTRGAFSPLQFSPYGFATYIEVKVGTIVVVVARPKDAKDFASLDMTKGIVLDPLVVDQERMEFELLPLEAGSAFMWKPNTPMTFDRGIAIGPESYHALDVSTVDGVLDMLSVCNIMELANVLSYETYLRGGVSDFQRQQFIEARRLCRRMVAIVNSRLQFTDGKGRELDLHGDIWMRYLAIQVVATKEHKSYISTKRKPTISMQSLEMAVTTCFEGHAPFHRQYSEILATRTTDLAWPSSFPFHLSVRSRQKAFHSALELIDGCTGEDTIFYSKPSHM